MLNVILVFRIVPGVQLRLPVQWDAKHHDEDALDAASETLARTLNIEFSHWEYAE